MHNRLIHYPGERPLFDLYNVEEDTAKSIANPCGIQVGWLFDD